MYRDESGSSVSIPNQRTSLSKYAGLANAGFPRRTVVNSFVHHAKFMKGSSAVKLGLSAGVRYIPDQGSHIFFFSNKKEYL